MQSNISYTDIIHTLPVIKCGLYYLIQLWMQVLEMGLNLSVVVNKEVL